jgi:Zn-dependent metalloprotease
MSQSLIPQSESRFDRRPGLGEPTGGTTSTTNPIDSFGQTLRDGGSRLIFKLDQAVAVKDRKDLLADHLNLGEFDSMRLLRLERDQIGMTHHVYEYFHKNVLVEGSRYSVHSKQGQIVSLSGDVDLMKNIERNGTIGSALAFNKALDYIGAETYLWDQFDPAQANNPDYMKHWEGLPTQQQEGELVVFDNFGRSAGKLAYKFDVYAVEPELTRDWVYVDAHSGEVLGKMSRIHNGDVIGSGDTLYNGTKAIYVDEVVPGFSYRLRQVTGNVVETYNMNNGTNYSLATDYTSGSTHFTNGIGSMVHHGTEITHDYFLFNHGRDSYDNAGAALRSYASYSVNYVNAFWDGTRMTYGDGDGVNYFPLVSLDITGHEIAHGVTENSANLIYSYESGALNESFSDIFGEMVENFGQGNHDWLMGDDIGPGGSGGAFRDMSNPNAFFNPDTYLGDYWYDGPGDNGGVHYNSGVQNFWFYLLSVGGSGTNDNGTAYNVTGIGETDAAAIAYRNLTVYLNPSSQYDDARAGSIQSAEDLFGVGSTQALQTAAAWDAVGVGYVAPDDFGYNAYQTGYGFEDISGTGTSILGGVLDASHELTDANLGDFTFNFMGTEYNNIYVNTHGNLTFGSGNTAYANNDLSSGSPVQAMIAPFWDDVSANVQGSITWQVKGTGFNQRLIVQWTDVSHFDLGAGDGITFQAVLSEYDDSVKFNYADTSFGNGAYDYGSSATVGVKDSGSRYDVASFNNGGGPVAVSGTSTRYGRFTGENAFGYNDEITSGTFENISATGTTLIGGGVDDSSVELTDAALGDFNFKFFGTDYNNLFVSSNGLITFGSANTAFSNDMANLSEAGIAVFWDDLHTDTGTVKYQVKGSGINQRLIVQWNQVDFFGSLGANDLTFQAILYEIDGSVQLNFQDLDAGVVGRDGGESATIGLKDAGLGNDPLLVSENALTPYYVGTGISTKMTNATMWGYTGSNGVIDNFDIVMAGEDTYGVTVNGTEFLFDQNGQINFINLDMGVTAGIKDDLDVNTAGTGDYFTPEMSRFLAKFTEYYTGDVITVQGAEDQRATVESDEYGYFYDSSAADLATGRENFTQVQNQAGSGQDYLSRITGAFYTYIDFGTYSLTDSDFSNLFDGTGNDQYLIDATDAGWSYLWFASTSSKAVLTRGENQLQGLSTAGGADSDTSYFYGTSGNDTAEVRETYTQLKRSNWKANVYDTEYSQIDGMGLGVDSINFYDGAGDDSFYAQDGYAYMQSAVTAEAYNFTKVYATASGGTDTASFYGSTGNDALTTTSTYSDLLMAGGYTTKIRANGFDYTYAYGNGGTDTALVKDSNLNDTFWAAQYWATQCEMYYGSGAYCWFDNFGTVTAKSTTAGNDTLDIGNGETFTVLQAGSWETVI